MLTGQCADMKPVKDERASGSIELKLHACGLCDVVSVCWSVCLAVDGFAGVFAYLCVSDCLLACLFIVTCSVVGLSALSACLAGCLFLCMFASLFA